MKIPNAGVTERGHLTELQYDERGYPIKPSLKTLDINLISVTYGAVNLQRLNSLSQY